MPDGSHSALVQGRRRVEIVEVIRSEAVHESARASSSEPQTATDKRASAHAFGFDLFDRCVQLDRSIPEEAHLFAMNISEPGWLADMIATSLSLNYEAKQSLLLMLDPRGRLGVE
jgi:ATP-dependent Lon protease